MNIKNVKTNMYEVSNYGRIRNIKTNKLLNPWLGINGYRYVSLMCKDNNILKIGVHILVATYFVHVPDRLQKINKPIVPNHNDFNRENNFYKNLSWMTYAENNLYNVMNGHCKTCDSAPNAKVSNDTVHKICKYMEDGFTNTEILKKLNLKSTIYNKSLLTRIRTGKQWKDISNSYNIINKNTLLRKHDTNFINEICKLIDDGCSLSLMREILEIPSSQHENRKFKSLVYPIHNRISYKDISEKYNWWKK